MPLSRMTVPKALRDRMTADLGLDGYQGTPEKINNDACLPVYIMGSAAGAEPFMSQHGFGSGEEMVGTQIISRVECWGNRAGGLPIKMFDTYPNNSEFLLALNQLYGRITMTITGRATIAGNNSNTVRVELIAEDGSDHANAWVLAMWKWNIGSFSGQPWIGEFCFNNSYIVEVSSPNRIKWFLNSSLGVNLSDTRGFVLKPRGGYYFQLSIQSATADLIIPAETNLDIHAEGDYYKTNTRILNQFEIV
jgi:hypothetical protein